MTLNIAFVTSDTLTKCVIHPWNIKVLHEESKGCPESKNLSICLHNSVEVMQLQLNTTKSSAAANKALRLADLKHLSEKPHKAGIQVVWMLKHSKHAHKAYYSQSTMLKKWLRFLLRSMPSHNICSYRLQVMNRHSPGEMVRSVLYSGSLACCHGYLAGWRYCYSVWSSQDLHRSLQLTSNLQEDRHRTEKCR